MNFSVQIALRPVKNFGVPDSLRETGHSIGVVREDDDVALIVRGGLGAKVKLSMGRGAAESLGKQLIRRARGTTGKGFKT